MLLHNAREGPQSQETGSIVSGAGNVSLQAGGDLTARAATLSAGPSTSSGQATLSLDAGDKLTLYAGENQASAETRHATKKGMSHYSLDADSQETTLARTTLTATDIKLRSGGDMTLGAIEANAEALDIHAGGKLHLLTQSTTSAMSQKENEGDAAFVSASGSGRVDEASQYNRFNVATLNIKADGGVTAQIGERDSLATLGQQPGMAWVKKLTEDPAFANSVEWQRVKEEHEKWAYHQSGMGPVATLIVTVVAAVAAAPLAAQAGAAAGSATAGMGATVSAGASAAVQAGVTALASRAAVSLAVSLANNNGDLGKVLKEMGSSESIKAIATSMLTAGVIEGLSASGLLPSNQANATNGKALFTDQLQRQLIDGVASSLVRSAINGTSLEDELSYGLASALLNTVAPQGAFEIGDMKANGTLNDFTRQVAHAIVGCAVGAGRASTGGSSAASGCSSGAVGAVVGSLTAGFMLANGPQDTASVSSLGALMGGIAGALIGGDASSASIGLQAAEDAVANNELLHLPDGMRLAGYRETAYSDGTYCNIQGATVGPCAITGAGGDTRPSVVIGVAAGVSTFVGDLSLSYGANGSLYLGGGKSLTLSYPYTPIPSWAVRLNISDTQLSNAEIEGFYAGSSTSTSFSMFGLTFGNSWSPTGPSTFRGTTDIGLTSPGFSVSGGTGLATCVWNCQ
ncbi:DUF637 domain-containing protein [Variovorax sp. LjRoot175]|uniref:DUF637 domain-containing protein n=1 Tax=Variovorax sp. LjRoot175 TaxID=3342276 RepID=UPI003ECC1E2A